ncbi:glycosyltransferase [Knoellia sp. CPCC 206435]|uniref:glycosyltransferase n=1 Tax=Knoellia terrae TaxID=3404797 RepID=UPI003B4332E3
MPTPRSGPPVRVLWVIKGLGQGGAEQLLVSSARVADHTRFAYSAAYVRRDKSRLAPLLEREGVLVTALAAPGVAGALWPWRLRRLLSGVDVAHAHSPLVAAVVRLLARTLPRGRRPATVSTEHNVWQNYSAPTRLANALTAGLDTWRWAVSGPVRQSMWPRLRPGAEVLVHGVVQSDLTDPPSRTAVRERLGVPPDALVVLTVANLRAEKDYPNLLEAADIATRQDHRLVFLAVGQGPLEQQVRAQHDRLGLADRVQLLGYRSDVSELLGATDIFVLASSTEGLPVAIMEAMCAGVPVVATAVGGVPEAVEDGVTGRLVPSRNAPALARALLDVAADDRLRQQMGERARQRSAAFDIRRTVGRLENVYELVARPRVLRRT